MDWKKVKEGKKEKSSKVGKLKVGKFANFPPPFRAGARRKELKVLIIIPVHLSVALPGATFPQKGKELLLVVQLVRLVLNKKLTADS